MEKFLINNEENDIGKDEDTNHEDQRHQDFLMKASPKNNEKAKSDISGYREIQYYIWFDDNYYN